MQTAPAQASPSRLAYAQRGTTTLQHVFRDHFSRFSSEYDSRYAQELGNFRIERIARVAARFLTCGDYRQGVARIRCSNPECRYEYFRPFSGPLPHRLQSLLQAEHHPMVRPGFHRSTDPVHPALGRPLRSLLRVVLLAMQGALAALAPRRACRPTSLERGARRQTAHRPRPCSNAERASTRLPFSMGQTDCQGLRGRSVDLCPLSIRDEAHHSHHRSSGGTQDSAPPHQDRQGTART